MKSPKTNPVSEGEIMVDEGAPYDKAIAEGSKAAGKFLDVVRDVGKPVSSAYGLLIGDRIEAWRERNLDALARRTKQILKQRNLAETAPLSESIAIPLLEAAQGDPRQEMQDLWATLLANAMDPARREEVRQEFITTLKAFHPTDAVVLKRLNEAFPQRVDPHELMGTDLRQSTVEVSLRNLSLWGCSEGGSVSHAILPFGRELVRACSIDLL
jgi:hypothetical protein